jgi:hypothetical protein
VIFAAVNFVALTLLEATVTLYPANVDDSPIVSAPIFTGAQAENLQVVDQWIKLETRPSGAKYPKRHPLIPQYEISLGRVWAFQWADKAGFQPANQRYVLDVTWTDEDAGDWHRETYYGVTISRRSRHSRNIDEGFQDDQVFEAEYVAMAGGGGVIPPLSGVLPKTVRYISATENLVLYNYSDTTHDFTEASAGVSTGRATLGYAPNHTGRFTIAFAGQPKEALSVEADATFKTGKLVQGAPVPANLPRLDFMIGSERVATLGIDQTLYAPVFIQDVPVDASDRFELFGGNILQVTFDSARVTSRNGFASNSLRVGLQAHWRLEEASGPRVDAQGANNLTPAFGTPGNGSGKIGNALVTDGTQGLSKVHTGALGWGGGPFTITGWYFWTGLVSASGGSDL